MSTTNGTRGVPAMCPAPGADSMEPAFGNIQRMSRRSRKSPPTADPQAARSWIGQKLKDAYTADSFGVVHAVEKGADGAVRLLARFRGEDTDRRILLQKPEDPADVEFLMPGEHRARYRPLTEADERLLGERRHG